MNSFLKKLELICLIVICVIVCFFVKIKNITVSGNTKYSVETIENKLFNSDFDRLTLFFMIRNIFNRKKIPCVESYKIEYITPFSIDVNIVDKKPIAFVKKDVLNVMIDSGGYVCEIQKDKATDATEIRGINFDSNLLMEKLGVINYNDYDILIELINSLNKNGLKCDTIEVDNKKEIIIYIGKIKVLIGNTRNLDIKLKRLADIYEKISNLSGILDLTNAKENMEDEKYIFKKQ